MSRDIGFEQAESRRVPLSSGVLKVKDCLDKTGKKNGLHALECATGCTFWIWTAVLGSKNISHCLVISIVI